jgi:hypothetical protein
MPTDSKVTVNLASDYEEMLSTLSAERAEFLIVGAYAVVFHTEPRYTKDLDLWVKPTRTNAQRVVRALKRFGAALHGVRTSDLSRPGMILQIGVEPIRIDIITDVDGLTFASAWKRRVRVSLGKTVVSVLSVQDLLINKRQLGRPNDLVDVARLEALEPKAPKTKRQRK